MNYYKLFAVSSIFALALVFVAIATPSSVFADDLEWGSDIGTDWGSDYGYDWGSDYGYDWGSDYGTDWGSDYGSDWGSDYGCYDCGYDYGYDDCYCYDDYDYGYDDYGYEDDYYYDDYDYEDDYYYDDESYSYSYGSSYGKSFSFPSYSSSGYSVVKPMTFAPPSYPVYPPVQSHPVSNTTHTTVTNVDNSINDSFNDYSVNVTDSFNNYNSNNTNSNNVIVAQVTPVQYSAPQYPIVYTTPTYVAPAPYCTINQAQASGSGVNAVYLSWNSSNATSAYLSNVGSVSANGSQTVWPSGSMTYTLTVYGQNSQSANCSTTVVAYSAPFVALSQIPYTGFDFGTFGNAMYWAGLIVFALGSAYLAIYYVPALAFAGARNERKFAPIVAAKAPILAQKEAALEKVQPIVNAIRRTGTVDSMAIVASKDGSMPKIVISRD